ncbi:hypothetical protein FDECE_18373 [Fusarium decemcellulare]|nr:hypothetical protein FDECE_18373 [Fusarium decemcellulare]
MIRLATREEVLHKSTEFLPYVALSYRWGSLDQASTQSKTTSDNLPDRMTNIDLRTVTKVIQDAVTVCRTFGVRYLWVDALCIIQGDVQDWEKESATMGRVFGNAYFTIATASLHSCHDSFLFRSLQTMELPFLSSVNTQVTGSFRLIARGDWRTPLAASRRLGDVMGSWIDRGWTFQERALSPRLLIFGATMIHAEFEKRSSLFFRIAGQTLNHDSWRALVVDYSLSELTFEGDRLPAISGLAALYAQALGDQYLAGLWKNDLHVGLFWSPKPQHQSLDALVESLEAPRAYIAPSWSWARQAGFAEYGFLGFWLQFQRDTTSYCDIISARCVTSGLNPYGAIQSGSIVVSAQILHWSLPLNRTESENSEFGVYLDACGIAVVEFKLDWYLEEEVTRYDDLHLLLLGSRHDGIPERQYHLDGANRSKRGDDGLGRYGEDRLTQGAESVYGLVLYPARGTSTFYRVGLFNSQALQHSPDGGLKLNCRNWETRIITLI